MPGHSTIPPRTCAACGKLFRVLANTSTKRFCSHACSVTVINVRNRRGTLEDRFWAKVQKTDSCWLWIASKNQCGYGLFATEPRPNGSMKMEPAHRVSWRIHFGDIPQGLLVLHNCPGGDNPSCVNPAHLWLGTDHDNAWDKSAKGRSVKGQHFPHALRCKGENTWSAKLTEDDVRAIRTARSEGVSASILAEKYGISKTQVWCIARRAKWKHIT